MPKASLPPTTIFLALLLSVCSFSALPPSSNAKTIRVPADYPNIQAAIDTANTGDSINVASGTYSESLKITKPLSLISEDGPEKTSIISTGTVISVNAENVEIRGFTVKNGTYGIFLWYTSGTILRNNVMSGNKWNFGVWGDVQSHFIHDVDSSNTVDGKPVYFWINEHQKSVPEDAGYVILVNSTNITVEDAVLTSNEHGVLLVNTNNSIVKNVTMRGNDVGLDLRWSNNNTMSINSLVSINWLSIYLASSNNNTFVENTVKNGNYGIKALQSNGNVFYHNNFINNKEQVYQEASSSKWDNGHEGNYWSDYQGEDLNKDGVGDTLLPHLGLDYHPLVNVFDRTPPIAEAGTNQTVPKNCVVVLNASNSYDNVGIINYEWDFGDGFNGSGVTVKHAYTATGGYTVTLEVTDASGNTSIDIVEIMVVESDLPLSWCLLFAGFGVGALILVVTLWMRKLRARKRIRNKKPMLHRSVKAS